MSTYSLFPPAKLVSLSAVSSEVVGRFHLFALDADGEVWRLEGGNDSPYWAHVVIARSAKEHGTSQ